MVSHDMRTPLSAIQGITKLMTLGAFGPLPEKAAEQLARVERSCNRLLALVNDLLDMDKLESGNMQLALKPTQALDIAERSCQALESFAKQHNAQVTINISPDLMVEGDGDRLVQVGVNLLSNAIKYSPEGGLVEVSALTRDGIAEFRITDHGPGIPPQYLDKIFERYTMAPSVDGKKRAGTGLGLPICKQIVEQHGGTIGVESQVGKGSTFWFTVPLASVNAALKQ
jgi:signal transduction histidine kinase